MIRNATPKDIPAIVELAVESVSRNPLPVKIDREAMKETALQCLGPAHFLMVAEVSGQVVGAVAAQVNASFWFQRCVCSMLLCYSRAPGEGIKLLRAFAQWVKSRPTIKMAIVELEPEADPRFALLLSRLGFSRQSMNAVYVRGLT